MHLQKVKYSTDCCSSQTNLLKLIFISTGVAALLGDTSVDATIDATIDLDTDVDLENGEVDLGLNDIDVDATVAATVAGHDIEVGATIDIVDESSAELLVQNLINPKCGTPIQVRNPKLSAACAGLFVEGHTVVSGFPDTGVILSTGSPQFAAHVDVDEHLSHNLGAPGDADLDSLLADITGTATAATIDACGLEFDLYCEAESGCDVYLNYVFAAQAYLEALGLNMDVFGLFLNGENMAKVPGTSTPVSSDSVNLLSNSGLFVANEGLTSLQADGFTSTMTAAGAAVQGWNSMKLVIGDGAGVDDVVDSFLFLAQNSLGFCPPHSGSGGGDPHFLRWNQVKRDSFHGECDLVLFHSDDYGDKGEGLDVHVRTTILGSFSYIESAAVKAGNTIVEFHSDKILVNGEVKTVANFPLEIESYTISRKAEDMKVFYTFALDLHVSIVVKFYKQFATVNIFGSASAFGHTQGMLGTFDKGEMYSRSGKSMDDFMAYGFEWQVHPLEDPVLFAEARAPQLPYEMCRLPTAAMADARRKLRGNRKLLEEATAACEAEHADNVDLCVNDVLLTGDLGMVHSW